MDLIKFELNKVVGFEVSGEEEILYRLLGIVDKVFLIWFEVWYRCNNRYDFYWFFVCLKKKFRFVKKEEKIIWWWFIS